jgi:hypothetical protein
VGDDVPDFEDEESKVLNSAKKSGRSRSLLFRKKQSRSNSVISAISAGDAARNKKVGGFSVLQTEQHVIQLAQEIDQTLSMHSLNDASTIMRPQETPMSLEPDSSISFTLTRPHAKFKDTATRPKSKSDTSQTFRLKRLANKTMGEKALKETLRSKHAHIPKAD